MSDQSRSDAPAAAAPSSGAPIDAPSPSRVPAADALTAPEPLVAAEPLPGAVRPASGRDATRVWRSTRGALRLDRVGEELVAWLKTLASAAVYATLIVTFGFQVARVEGQSMAPTLADQDRLIVNKLAYRIGEPQVGDIVMLYYPLNPDKSFVKRVIAEEGDQVRIVDGRVYRNDVPLNDELRAARVSAATTTGARRSIPEGLLLRDGRSPQQQLRQPALGLRAEEVHHRQSAAALVADAPRAGVLERWPRRRRGQPRSRSAFWSSTWRSPWPSWCSATRPARSASSPTASTR